jgi:hypothetical protein
MEHRRIVVLYGDSLLMDTVEASLTDSEELGVMRIHNTVSGAGERIRSLHPDVVIFDWDGTHADFLLPFLREQPGVPMLGLDITASQVIVLSSQRYATPTVNELAKVIHLQTLYGAQGGLRQNIPINEPENA